jgi:N4-gp56 family major capsid protein
MIDLINAAGIEIYAGNKTSVGEIVAGDKVTLAELRQMNKILNANLFPKDTQIISGSRNIDTKVVGSARYAYTSDDVVMILEDIMNPITGKHMWAYVEEYADGAKYAKSNVANGEVGKIANTRFIEHPEMLIFENKGDSVGGYGLDVHPILYIGSGSFTQIGFQTNGSKTKFTIIVKKPGKEVADRNNPYGKVGFVSSEYWYGVLLERTDWIGVIYSSVV